MEQELKDFIKEQVKIAIENYFKDLDNVDLVKQKNKSYWNRAIKVLSYLNQQAHKRHDAVDSHLSFIIARLKEGELEETLQGVINNRLRFWAGWSELSERMVPKTLFNKTNYYNYKASYLEERAKKEELINQQEANHE